MSSASFAETCPSSRACARTADVTVPAPTAASAVAERIVVAGCCVAGRKAILNLVCARQRFRALSVSEVGQVLQEGDDKINR